MGLQKQITKIKWSYFIFKKPEDLVFLKRNNIKMCNLIISLNLYSSDKSTKKTFFFLT